jgi:murein DD-endopeptidase MepM/ murein hydrolase activator NlpD
VQKGVAIGVWPARPFQGALVVVDVAAAGLGAAAGTLRGAKVAFHAVGEGVLRGLAPIPDGAVPGKAPLKLTLTVNGRRVRRTVPLTIEAVAFEKDRLSVDPRFIKPPPEAQAQIAADREATAAMWKRGSTAEPRFRGPFVKPREDRTTAPYGTRRVYNGRTRSVHGGWDIDGEVGDDVLCANDGVVALARDMYHSGGTLFLDHGAGIYTAYFHLSAIAVKQGEDVKRGQVCAKVGETGRVTGPHLHWGFKLGGHYLHPGALLLFPWEKPMVELPVVAEQAADGRTP